MNPPTDITAQDMRAIETVLNPRTARHASAGGTPESAAPQGALSRATGSAYSRKDRAWRIYRASECFAADGKANAFSKGFDAGEVVTPDKWNELLGERDHLLGALRGILRIWQTQAEACADNSRVAEAMAQQARSGTAYLDLPNEKDQTHGHE